MKINSITFPILAPSLIAANPLCLREEIEACVHMGLTWLHCDVMDGHFVPNLTLGPYVVASIKKQFPVVVCDCHLMVSSPGMWIPKFVEAGADIITVHLEVCSGEEIREWHAYCLERNVVLGLAIRPTTPLEALGSWLSFIPWVLVMSVHPGFAGQAYLSGSEGRIQAIRKRAGASLVRIAVDGGIDATTAGGVVEAGADILVAGHAFFRSSDRKRVVGQFQSIFASKKR